MTDIHPIPAFEDNYIWVFTDEKRKSACVVDPGDAAVVEEYLLNQQLELTDILITHHHPDHVGGLLTLAEKYRPRVYGPKSSGIKGITEYVKENDSVTIFDHSFKVIEVPGHTLDHLAYFDKKTQQPILFCGDTLFAAGCGRLFEGSPQMMHESLSKLAELPAQTRVYCTHEYTLANINFALAANPNNSALIKRAATVQETRKKALPTLPSSIELELATNPFLRCEDQDIRKTIEQRRNTLPDTEIATFAALRQWKDTF